VYRYSTVNVAIGEEIEVCLQRSVSSSAAIPGIGIAARIGGDTNSPEGIAQPISNDYFGFVLGVCYYLITPPSLNCLYSLMTVDTLCLGEVLERSHVVYSIDAGTCLRCAVHT
jgi:hypothetical protein